MSTVHNDELGPAQAMTQHTYRGYTIRTDIRGSSWIFWKGHVVARPLTLKHAEELVDQYRGQPLAL